MPYKLLEHTADLLVEVEGDSLEGLFEEAGKAMFELIGECKGEGDEFTVDVSDPSKEGLLVKWLTELLAEHDATRHLFRKFKVKINRTHLVGQAFGGDGVVKDSIKGVTFHELRIWREGKTWKARILFDI